ncbi:hypothetical protein ABPG74_010439 [Tetrahymena malaccensis]
MNLNNQQLEKNYKQKKQTQTQINQQNNQQFNNIILTNQLRYQNPKIKLVLYNQYFKLNQINKQTNLFVFNYPLKKKENMKVQLFQISLQFFDQQFSQTLVLYTSYNIIIIIQKQIFNQLIQNTIKIKIISNYVKQKITTEIYQQQLQYQQQQQFIYTNSNSTNHNQVISKRYAAVSTFTHRKVRSEKENIHLFIHFDSKN